MSRSTPPSQTSQTTNGRVPRGKQPNERPPSKPFLPLWVWWVLLLATLAWNGYEFFFPKTPPAVSLAYSEFLERVRAGQVAAITISGQNAEGTFKQAITGPLEGAAPAAGAGPAATPQSGAKPGTYERFTTVLPPIDDQR